ncbi:TPA: hypothetical protein ACGOYW_000961 [Streptococcus suis]
MKQEQKQEFINRAIQNVSLISELVLETHEAAFDNMNYFLRSLRILKTLSKEKLQQFHEAEYFLSNLNYIIVTLFMNYKSCYETLHLLYFMDSKLTLESQHMALAQTEQLLNELLEMTIFHAKAAIPQRYKEAIYFESLTTIEFPFKEKE